MCFASGSSGGKDDKDRQAGMPAGFNPMSVTQQENLSARQDAVRSAFVAPASSPLAPDLNKTKKDITPTALAATT